MSLNLSYRLYYVWARNLTVYRRFLLPTLLVSMGEPLFYMLALGVGLGAYVGVLGGKGYLQFLAPGLIVGSTMIAATFECLYDAFARIVIEKIYDSLIVTPISAEEVAAGDTLWGVTRGVVSGFLTLVIAILLGALEFNLIHILLMLGLLLAVGLLFSSLAMIITSFAPNFDFFNYYTQLVISPIFFFSGVFFPLDKMPEWVKQVSLLSPLTHAAEIARAIFNHNLGFGHLYNLAVILVPGVIAFLLAAKFMRRRLIK